jgi:hypothetical protein
MSTHVRKSLIMQIHFVRTGGFAGIRLESAIDSETLPEDESQALLSELGEAHFFELPARLGNSGSGADRFQYEITVEDGPRKHTVAASESAWPDHVQPLVQHLDRLARMMRR